jgi:hypothetical protein
MDSFNIDSMAFSINNIDKESLVVSYYKKDLLKNINHQEHIIYCLKKLNYYSVDLNKETKAYLLDSLNNFINNELNNNWESKIRNYPIDKILEIIKASDEFKSFNNYLHFRIQRAMILSKYLNNSLSTLYFYYELTLDELKYLNL